MTHDFRPEIAGSLILALADDLTDQLRAKGYEKAHAEIWIGRRHENRIGVYFADAPPELSISNSATIGVAVERARLAIEALSDLSACAAWFTVEQAEAAE